MNEEPITTPETPEQDNQDNTAIISYRDVLPAVIHILPLVNRPFFPHQVVPLILESEYWLETIHAVTETNHKILGLILSQTDNIADMKPDTFHRMGTACRLHRMAQAEDKIHVVVEGLQRFRVQEWLSAERPFVTNTIHNPVTTILKKVNLTCWRLSIRLKNYYRLTRYTTKN